MNSLRRSHNIEYIVTIVVVQPPMNGNQCSIETDYSFWTSADKVKRDRRERIQCKNHTHFHDEEAPEATLTRQ